MKNATVLWTMQGHRLVIDETAVEISGPTTAGAHATIRVQKNEVLKLLAHLGDELATQLDRIEFLLKENHNLRRQAMTK